MTWEPLNLAADEYESEQKPPDISALLYSGKRHGISGPPESIKSILAEILLLENVRAGNTVAIIDFEMGPHATRRLLLDLGFSLDEIREQVVYYDAPGEPDDADIAALVEQGVTFVVIDATAGAYDASGLDDNKRQDVERFARAWVRPLFDRGITSVLIDHVTKNTETRGKYMIGSERKLGGVDVHLGLELVGQPLTRGGSAIVRVRVHKDRAGYLSRPVAVELHLQSDPESHRVTWEWKLPASAVTTSGGWRPTIYMERVSRYLEQHGPKSRTAVYGAGLGRKPHLITAIGCLLDEGHISEDGSVLGSLVSFRHEEAESRSPKPVPAGPGPGFPTGSTRSPAYKAGPGTGTLTDGTYLLPGDPGYLHRLSVAKEAGYVFEDEWEQLKSVHQALARRLTSTPGTDQEEGARP